MDRWYPLATRDAFRDAGSFIAGVPYRGVIHTTEGTSYAGARSVYITKHVAPHFTVEYTPTTGFRVWQHVPLDRAARALSNPPGRVETNRHRVIQIEVVGSATKPNWPIDLQAGVRELMIWIELQAGVKPWAPPFHISAEAYGTRATSRMSAEAWKRFDGWCGHQHVPENSHWDPGPINTVMAALLAREEPPMADYPRSNFPPRLLIVRPQADGYWIVAYDGGVFSFGAAPVLTAIGGDPVEKITAGDVWPDGNGLVLMGEDGGIFALGSAPFMGRVVYG